VRPERVQSDPVIDVNLKGQFFVAQAVAQLMVQDGIRGRIVSISSVSALAANLNASHYAASKGGFEFVTGAEVIADGGVMASAL